jgi:hypothetical protein
MQGVPKRALQLIPNIVVWRVLRKRLHLGRASYPSFNTLQALTAAVVAIATRCLQRSKLLAAAVSVRDYRIWARSFLSRGITE